MPDHACPFDRWPSEQTDEYAVASSSAVSPSRVKCAAAPSDPATIWSALWRGALNRCPACGAAKLFASFLKPVDRCGVCQEDWTCHNADDFPPYIVILILGHVVVTGLASVEVAFHPAMWVQFAIWIPAIIALAMVSIQPVKAGVIALQWRHRLGDFQKRSQGIEPLSSAPAPDVPLEIRREPFVARASIDRGRTNNLGFDRYPTAVADVVVADRRNAHQ